MTRLELENEILELINASENMSYSDIQGVVMALAIKVIEE